MSHGVGVATPTAGGGGNFISTFLPFLRFNCIFKTAGGRVVMDRTYYIQEMRTRIGEMASEINKMNKEIETFETVYKCLIISSSLPLPLSLLLLLLLLLPLLLLSPSHLFLLTH